MWLTANSQASADMHLAGEPPLAAMKAGKSLLEYNHVSNGERERNVSEAANTICHTRQQVI